MLGNEIGVPIGDHCIAFGLFQEIVIGAEARASVDEEVDEGPVDRAAAAALAKHAENELAILGNTE
ncbi:hypothetical protein MARINON1_40258 [Marinobacter salarius]|nr:hypothetical protein MBHK15_70119 [Marinobacter salarius]VXB23420.1 hypothetical protein MARINON1_40258 [Marinobacter salarius]